MRLIAVIVIVIIAFSATMEHVAHSQQQPKRYAFMGAGVSSCAQFGDDYRRNPTDFESLYFAWAQGMLSGLNARLLFSNNDTNLAWWDSAQQEQHIRSFCSNHPLSSYAEAVFDLFDAMRQEQGLPNWRNLK